MNYETHKQMGIFILWFTNDVNVSNKNETRDISLIWEAIAIQNWDDGTVIDILLLYYTYTLYLCEIYEIYYT